LIAIGLARQGIAVSPQGVDPVFWKNFIQLFPVFHLATFMLGMAAGRLFLFGPQLTPTTHNYIFVFAAVLIVMIFGARSYLPAWVFRETVIVPVFCVAIYGGARTTLVTWPPLVLLGEASYALYITHSGIFFWTAQVIKALRIDIPVSLGSSIAVLAAITASVMIYLYIEKPWHRRILRAS
jgi:peptidoglycan/LPS O-acetylase OafA/YrhL